MPKPFRRYARMCHEIKPTHNWTLFFLFFGCLFRIAFACHSVCLCLYLCAVLCAQLVRRPFFRDDSTRRQNEKCIEWRRRRRLFSERQMATNKEKRTPQCVCPCDRVTVSVRSFVRGPCPYWHFDKSHYLLSLDGNSIFRTCNARTSTGREANIWLKVRRHTHVTTIRQLDWCFLFLFALSSTPEQHTHTAVAQSTLPPSNDQKAQNEQR